MLITHSVRSRRAILLITITAGSLILAGCSSSKPAAVATSPSATAHQFTIAIDNGSGASLPFPSQEAKGVQDEAAKLGVKVLATLDGKGVTTTEAANIQNIITLKPDGVVILPANAAEAASFVDQLVAAGIKVVSSHSVIGANRSINDVYPKLSALVIEDEVSVGKLAAELLNKGIPNGGKIGIVLGAPGYAENTLRLTKFKPNILPTIKIVGTQAGGWTAEGGQAACAGMLSANPDMAAFYLLSDDMGVGCAKAITSAHSKAIIIGLGGEGVALKLLADPKSPYYGDVCYQPYDDGVLSMQTLYKVLNGEAVDGTKPIFYNTPAVTRANIADCKPQW